MSLEIRVGTWTNPKSSNLFNYSMNENFVIKLSNKKFENFENLDLERKKSIRKGIVMDLLVRDNSDLKIFEENSVNFNSSDGSMNKMVESKLKGQRRKIEIKTKLLDWIEKEEF